MSALVVGSFAQTGNPSGSSSVTAGAAAQVGDVVVVTFTAFGGTTPPVLTSPDNLGNVYTFQEGWVASAAATNISVFTAPVTVAGTPTVTMPAGLAFRDLSIFILRGYSSATMHKGGALGDSAASPLTVSLTPTVTVTAVYVWMNTTTDVFTAFTQSGTTLVHNASQVPQAVGYQTGLTAGTYAAGATVSAGDANSAIVVLMLPEAAGRSLFYPSSLDGIGGAGPKQFYREG